jgi:hypothetical protein
LLGYFQWNVYPLLSLVIAIDNNFAKDDGGEWKDENPQVHLNLLCCAHIMFSKHRSEAFAWSTPNIQKTCNF